MVNTTKDERLHNGTYAVIARVRRWVCLPVVAALVSGAAAVVTFLSGGSPTAGAIIFLVGMAVSITWTCRSSRRLSNEVGRIDAITRSLAQGDLRTRVTRAPS